MIAMIGKSDKMGMHLTRPVKLNGQDLVLHYFSEGLGVRSNYVSLPRELTQDLELKLHRLAGFNNCSLEGSFLLEKPSTAWHTAIQFTGNWCHISDSFELPHSTRGGESNQD